MMPVAPTRTQPTPAGRDRSVETARGVACLLVVIFHVLGASPVSGLALPPTSGWWMFNRTLDFVHMPAFAFLGGIAYGYSPLRVGAARSFIAKKLTRIALPLVTVTTLYLAAQFLVPTSSARPDPAWHAYAYPYLHLWYLQALLWVLAGAMVLDAARLLRGAPLALVFAGACLLFVHRNDLLPSMFGASLAAYLAPFFLAGIAWHRIGGVPRSAALPVLVVGAAALGALIWGLDQHRAIHGWPKEGLRLTAGIGLTAGFLAWRPDWRWAVWLGGLSYPVYLFHVFGTAAARHALHAFDVEAVWAHLGLGLAVGIGAGVAVRRASLAATRVSGVPFGTALFGAPASRRRAPLPLAANPDKAPARGQASPVDRQAP